MENVAVGGKRRAGPQTDIGQQTLPAPGDIPRQRGRRLLRSFDHFVGQSRRNGLLGCEPAAVAVVLGHQGLELRGRTPRTGCIDRGDTRIGLVQQVDLPGDLRGISLGRTDGRVDQIEGIGRQETAPLRRRLGDDRRSRGRIAVTAGRDPRRKLPERVVDQQRVVHVAARRADVDHHLRGLDLRNAPQGVAETLVGRHPGVRLFELPLLGYADGPFDVDLADPGRVVDLNFRFHD